VTAAICIGALCALWLSARRVQRKERQHWITRGQAQQIVEYTEGRQHDRGI